MLCVSLCGLLDSGKCKRVSTGELIRAPGNVARSCFPWSLTAPVFLCRCSHPVAAITDKLQWVLCSTGPALVWQAGGGQVPLLRAAVLTEQQNKIA